MSLLFDGRIRITDASGVPVSGGKARIYNANTTTLTTVYSDATLSTPLTNPVVAASDGWCPQVFAAEGTTVDIDKLTAAGGVIKSYEDVTFVGTSTTTFTRDFTTSRAQIRGSGGKTYYEAGDPVGDDVGGKMVLGGWAGTQLDTLDINAAISNFTGEIQENSHTVAALVTTSVTTFTAATEVVIPLLSYDSAIAWDVVLWGMSYSADCQLRGVFSIDGGATYKTGASDYAVAVHASYNNTAGSLNDLSEAFVHFTDVVSIKSTTTNSRLDIDIVSTAGTSATAGFSRCLGADATGNLPALWSGTFGASLGGKPTHLKVYPSAGNFTGKYSTRVRRGFA